MIEFIIIDKEYKNTKEILENKLMQYDYKYKVKQFDNYKKVELNTNTYKIYIIDYSNYNDFTLSIMKKIRYSLKDWKSMIVVTTNNIKLKSIILEQELMIISIIEKNKQFKDRLIENIEKALINYEKHPKTLKYIYKNINYNLNLKDIIYIEKEKDNKRCLIKTKTDIFPIQGNLSNLMTKLDKRYIKCSRSYIINAEQMLYYNKKDNIIHFKDNSYITEVSRQSKKTIINYIRNVE